ncbi:MAG: Rrf2 family transcriptional regulator [Armatimonadetes bacterium]|nr:Rrf2 family transcriptional regulator [Armatimonadota bacterium]
MISQTAEYALRAAVALASAYPAPITVQVVSERVGVPVPYLAKVLSTLARAGVVTSQRGKHGGFALMRRPDETSVLDIVQAVDPIQRVQACPLGRHEHHEALCPLHRRLDDATALTEQAFRETPLSDLLSAPDPAGSAATSCTMGVTEAIRP